MASLTSPTTIFHNSLQRQYSTSQSHLPLLPLASGESQGPPVASSFPSPGSVRKLAANIRDQPGANAHINSIVSDNARQSEEPNEMVQLIPLRLQPSWHKRSSSSLGNWDDLTAATYVSAPQTAREGRSDSITSLNMPQFTQEEWKTSIEEIKTLFGKRHFKRCSTRSKALLENIKEPVSFHTCFTP